MNLDRKLRYLLERFLEIKMSQLNVTLEDASRALMIVVTITTMPRW